VKSFYVFLKHNATLERQGGPKLLGALGQGVTNGTKERIIQQKCTKSAFK